MIKFKLIEKVPLQGARALKKSFKIKGALLQIKWRR
jgi:hypothetical protein